MNKGTDPGADWRRLPVAAVGALYVNGLVKLVRENLWAFAGAGTGFAFTEALGWVELAWILIVLASGGLVVAFVYHRRFRYLVDDDAIRVRSGLFERTEIKVRFERVQNVGFSQPLYLRPLKITRLSLQTPGASQTEVSLPGIPTEEAEALRARIGRRSVAVESEPERAEHDAVGREPSDPGSGRGRLVFRASNGDLFRYGLTSNQVWIFAGLFGGALAERIGDAVADTIERLKAAGWLDPQLFVDAPLLVAMSILGLVLVLVALVMAISGLLAVVRFHGYELRVDEDRFRARYGLLDARDKSLEHGKLHSIEATQTALGRLLRRWHIVGHQTGVDAMQGLGGDQKFMIPGVPSRQRDAVLGELQRLDWRRPDWQAVDRHLRRVMQIRWALLLAVVVAVLLFAPERPAWTQIAVVAGLSVVLMGLIHLRWRRWAWARRDDELLIRSGLFGTSIVRFECRRVQQIRVRQSPYQRRHGLVSLQIRLPHGDLGLPYLTRQTGDRLVNLMLYRVESSLVHTL